MINNQKIFAIISSFIFIFTVIFQAKYQLIINHSTSLPMKAFLIQKGLKPSKLGQIFAFKVKNNPHYDNQELTFVKIAEGFPGDKIGYKERKVFIEEKFVGIAKTHSLSGNRLAILEELEIPAGKIFAFSPHVDSFDSRYKALGLINEKDIIGTAIITF